VDWLLLPPQGVEWGPEGQQLPPVTLQQLQLAMCGLAYADAYAAPTAALHLALLLQRADPGLRAEFLGGPGGNSTLATYLYWGHRDLLQFKPASSEVWQQFGLVTKADAPSCAAVQESMEAALVGLLYWPAATLLPAPTSVGLVMGWCYLQLPPDWKQQQQQQQQRSQQPLPGQQQQQQGEEDKGEQEDLAYGQESSRYGLVTTPYNADTRRPPGIRQGEVVTPHVPAPPDCVRLHVRHPCLRAGAQLVCDSGVAADRFGSYVGQLEAQHGW
jgi:hypothetical protein